MSNRINSFHTLLFQHFIILFSQTLKSESVAIFDQEIIQFLLPKIRNKRKISLFISLVSCFQWFCSPHLLGHQSLNHIITGLPNSYISKTKHLHIISLFQAKNILLEYSHEINIQSLYNTSKNVKAGSAPNLKINGASFDTLLM